MGSFQTLPCFLVGRGNKQKLNDSNVDKTVLENFLCPPSKVL